ncbi:hypothetical protein BJX96DRAFT_186092 [Aspergillus floccosus]
MSRSIRTLDIGSSVSSYFAPATITSGIDCIQISGQVGMDSEGKVPTDYESQINLALLNLHKVITAAGASIQDIAKLNLYIVNYNPAHRSHVRHLQRFLGQHRPAITLVPVVQLAAPSWLFEVDAVVAKASSLRTSLSTPLKKYDVVVLGAGLAGLTVAETIVRSGHSCLVLEARDRVGGRTWSARLPGGGGIVDLGAAWINDTNQSRAYQLALRSGAELIEQNTEGNCLLQDANGDKITFPYGELPFDAETQTHLAEIRDMVEADCQKIDPARPKDSLLDSMTFLAYLQSRNSSDKAIATASVWTRAMLGQEPQDISALYFLHYCRSGGGLLQMRSDRKHGGQYLRVRQGTQIFSETVLKSLPPGTVQLSAPVTAIHQVQKDHVVVQSAKGTFAARKVVCAIPTTVLKSIDIQPPLPPRKQLLTNSLRYGYYTKVMMVFKSAWWVEKGYCGLVQSFKEPVSIFRDTSIPVDGKWVLTCFLAGDAGRLWSQLPAEARVEAILTQLSDIYADPARVRGEYIESLGHEWINEQYSGYGCPCPSLAPGVLSVVGDAIREPFRDMHFVGTETAEEWKGYMEGAIRSGERGAQEAIKGLHSTVSHL